jgi:hypothetical protein
MIMVIESSLSAAAVVSLKNLLMVEKKMAAF